MPEHAIEAHGLVRSFDGNVGLHGVDIVVKPGGIHALVGLNGAGKSSLMRILLGMLRPSAGTVRRSAGWQALPR